MKIRLAKCVAPSLTAVNSELFALPMLEVGPFIGDAFELDTGNRLGKRECDRSRNNRNKRRASSGKPEHRGRFASRQRRGVHILMAAFDSSGRRIR